MNEGAFGRVRCQNKTTTRLYAATMRPNGWLLIDGADASADKHLSLLLQIFPGILGS
jgi:hypothetical protein